MPQPFSIHIEQKEIDDLHRRLAATRWPDEIDNDKWSYGTNKAYLQELCRYWQSDFNWRGQETYLNIFSHFKTIVDDFSLHFIHEKGTGPTAIPLLLVHGWPDSFVRFLKIIPLLPQEVNGVSFDIVVPSIPGYGFSDKPKKAGMNPKKIAGLFAELMKELGYKKYIAQGGDWGSTITEQLALYHEDVLLGIHLTDVPFHHGLFPVKDSSAAEEKYLAEMKVWRETEGGYSMEQGTKPQTLAYGLTDSPAGFAGWVVEKCKTWTDNNGAIEDAITRDELLTNISLYWFTQTINSASRIYYEAMHSFRQATQNLLQNLNPFTKAGDKTDVPAGFALFPKDISSPPKEFAERFFNVKRWKKMDKGGHFAAIEEPEDLAGRDTDVCKRNGQDIKKRAEDSARFFYVC